MGLFDNPFKKKGSSIGESFLRLEPAYKKEKQKRVKEDRELDARLLARIETQPSFFDVQRRATIKREMELKERLARRTGKAKAERAFAASPQQIRERLGRVSQKIGEGAVTRSVSTLTSIQPPKRSKKSLRGLFNRESFMTQTRR